MATATEYQAEIDRLYAIKERIRTNLVAQGITVPEETVLEAMAEQILSVAGEDGYSPTVSITAITGGHRVTITDATSTQIFDVMDGEDANNDAVWEQINENTDAINSINEQLENGLTPLSGYNFYTSDSIFIVPDDITAIRISACAAGVGRYAGEYILDYVFNVTPGQQIDLTIGSGNTIIGDLITLIAGTVSSATPTTKLGYAAGYSGGNGGRKSTDASAVVNGYGGYGGAFGYGGGGGGANKSGTTGYAGGGGGGIGGAGGAASTGVADVGTAGGTTGGAGGRAASSSNVTSAANGGDAKSGKLIYTGANNGGTKGGDGSIYGAGGGGGSGWNYDPAGGGGAAGGYGAGGGTCGGNRDIIGQPSNGMVLIEWGGTVGE